MSFRSSIPKSVSLERLRKNNSMQKILTSSMTTFTRGELPYSQALKKTGNCASETPAMSHKTILSKETLPIKSREFGPKNDYKMTLLREIRTLILALTILWKMSSCRSNKFKARHLMDVPTDIECQSSSTAGSQKTLRSPLNSSRHRCHQSNGQRKRTKGWR